MENPVLDILRNRAAQLSNNQGLFDRKHGVCLAALALALFIVIAAGIFIYLSRYSYLAVGLTLSYVAGLSMIFLPCTLPLAFAIAPAAMQERIRNGILMALSFGAGVVITFGVYGIAFVYTGGINGLLTANAAAGILGGGLAYALGIYGLAGIKIPETGITLPGFQERDYLKMFFIGFLFANFDPCCMNPIFYAVIWHITDIANIFTGLTVMAVYGTGKATPIIFLAMVLGILGIKKSGIKKSRSTKKTTDWVLVFVGAFLLTLGGPFHGWYTGNEFHRAWDEVIIALSDGKIGEVETVNHAMHETAPQWLGPYVFIFLLALPVIFHFTYGREKASKVPLS